MLWCMTRCADIFLCYNIFRNVYIWVIKNIQIWKTNYFLCIIYLLLFTLVNNLFMFIICLLLTCIYWLLMHRNIEFGWMKNEYIQVYYWYGYTWIICIIMINDTMQYQWIWYYINNTFDMYYLDIVYPGECIVYCWYYIGKPLIP